MNTNHDALREALLLVPSELPGTKGLWLDESGNYYRLAQPIPEAAAQGWIPVDRQMPKSGQIVLALQKWDHSGKLGVIRAAWIAAKTEESSPESDIGEYDEATDTYYDPEGWYEQISHWDEISAAGVSGATIVAWMPLPDVLSASPAAPEGEKPDDSEQELMRALEERDAAEDMADQLAAQIAAITGEEIGEHSSANDPWRNAMLAADEWIAKDIRRLCRDPEPAQPQAQTTSPDDIHSCGEFCNLPECVAAREAQAQGEPSSFDDWYGNGEGLGVHSKTTVKAAFDVGYKLALQSHREALAQHRAALEECVEALKLAMHWAGPAMERDMRSPSNSQWMVEKTQAQEDSIYAAITHANQVLEGGGK